MGDRVIKKANIFINYTKCEDNSIAVSSSLNDNQECETRDNTLKKLYEEDASLKYDGFSVNSVNSSLRSSEFKKSIVNNMTYYKLKKKKVNRAKAALVANNDAMSTIFSYFTP